jgi:hypothetical protein
VCVGESDRAEMVVGLFCGTVRRGGRDDWIHAIAIAACSAGKQATEPVLHRHSWPPLPIARSLLSALSRTIAAADEMLVPASKQEERSD